MRLATALLGSLQKVPTEPGVPYAGGFYVGRMKVAGQSYVLIVSPKTSGETRLQWKHGTTATQNTDSGWDGASNTAAMVADSANHPAAQFCAGLSIGGYNDWSLPARSQLELCYRNLKPKAGEKNDTTSGLNGDSDPAGARYTESIPGQTAAAAFQYTQATATYGPEAFSAGSGDLYWSSTSASSSAGYNQSFLNGLQGSVLKTTTMFVRAVRMIKI